MYNSVITRQPKSLAEKPQMSAAISEPEAFQADFALFYLRQNLHGTHLDTVRAIAGGTAEIGAVV